MDKQKLQATARKWSKTYLKSLKKKGKTVVWHQRQLLEQRFPYEDGKLNQEEKVEYQVYKDTFTADVKAPL